MKNCNQGLSDQFALDESKRYLTVSLGSVNHLWGEAGEGHEAVGPRERERSWQGHLNAAVEKGRAEENEPCRASASAGTKEDNTFSWQPLHTSRTPVGLQSDQDVLQFIAGWGELRKLGLLILRDLVVLTVTTLLILIMIVCHWIY